MPTDREEIFGENLCSECSSSMIICDYDSGEIVCGSCGLVITESIINMGPEWRAFNAEQRQKRTRVGAPLTWTLLDKGISTMIGEVNRDAYGTKISPRERIKMLRLRKWQRRARVHSSYSRNLAQAMAELDRLTDKLHLPPPIKEKAAVVYRKALDKGLIRGRPISAITAASLYAACRITQTPRTLKEVALHSPYDKKKVSRCYRQLIKSLSLRMPVPEPQLRVPKIAAKVGIGEKTQQKAVEILRKAERVKATVGKDPMGLAAAALYLACLMNDEKQTQKIIGEASGVTEVTIRNRYKSLKEALNLVI